MFKYKLLIEFNREDFIEQYRLRINPSFSGKKITKFVIEDLENYYQHYFEKAKFHNTFKELVIVQGNFDYSLSEMDIFDIKTRIDLFNEITNDDFTIELVIEKEADECTKYSRYPECEI
jgi:hypothetical protein